MVTAQSIQAILKEKLQANEVKVFDDGYLHIGHHEEGAGHFTVEVESELFRGKSLIAQHRLVHEALEAELKDKIHALAIRTKIP
ncbi:MAG: BolA family protein [Candidatus Caenarcaniphilales bacterium]|nr:BolA family protein [Candidatus Caenarcaniphilales bacterium]